MILRARAVVPVSRPVIHDGALVVEQNRIKDVGPWRGLSAADRKEAVDLGDVALLPGLVNAHCHLDYTHMAGQFPPPKVFTDWLKLITTTKSHWELAEYQRSWDEGAEMLVRTGTTMVGDIETVPQLLPAAWSSTPLRICSFLEMLGITSRRTPRDILAEALDKIAGLKHSRCRLGLSPHAPYSTVPELLKLTARTARRRRWPMCIHVAESALEFTMFAHGRGEMFDWLKRSGRDMSDCGLGSPVQHLARYGVLGENLVLAHVNYLGRGDAAVLGRHRVSVVHCPRSHAYFRHDKFPLRQLARAGVNLCLGTDSLASTFATRRQPAELNMFDEMRALAHREPSVPPRTILRMATVNGARALGLSGRVAELTPGAFADMVALPFTGQELYDSLLSYRGNVAASMIDGQWAVAPPQIGR
jgi:cytosine/adenosine deaminase-related metal-dependent hydrolase